MVSPLSTSLQDETPCWLAVEAIFFALADTVEMAEDVAAS